MNGPPELLQCAHRRAAALRDRYREAGFWSDQPADVVRAAAARHPEKLALCARGAELSYAELDSRIDAASGTLAASGVGASTPAVVVVGNDVDSVIAVHATLRLDAVVLLVPHNVGAAQLTDIVTRTGAEFGVAPNWPAALRKAMSTQLAWIALDGDFAPQTAYRPQRAADEPCLVLYTSGTTSVPKGVIHSQSTLIKASSNYIAAAGLGPADRIFLISPLASVTGVLQALFIAPMLCAPVVLEDNWDAAETCELLVSSGATWYGGPDRLLDRLLDEAVARGLHVPLKAVYLGGTMLDRRIVTRIEDDFGIIVMRAYGSSEVPVSTSGLRSESAAVRHADDGVALDDVEVKGGSAADRTECCIRGPHTFLGYTDADADAQAFDGEWFHTGDVAEISDGRVRIVGRLKDIIIRNGLKIAAVEVEEAVARIAGVRDCAAYSVADATTGERLAVAMVLDADADMTLAKVTDALISAGLPKYKLPEELVFWNEPLPVNANGKVERNKLGACSAGRPRVLADRLAATG
ncbi:AMP-dependent synthetase [Mycobacterium sp. 1164966.3]|uniref:class I adenylate-forming enzyme family protein n=1 Tax=Mycobacterium sp. 1164966.3 TaxID=1856861 RepID=UPI000800DADB|nr:AMP-binding protein [Mycobacterium sp. 1164966.3]OBA78960.1 AMP-dependent synthetase [Mycobacterium sp. 1164966.3]